MHGIAPRVVAEIAIPDLQQCLMFAAPFLAVAAVWWLVRHMDQIMNRLFPNLEWERQLGWLNIKAERRAEAVLRWIGYFIYAMLAISLLGVIWAVHGLAMIKDWSDPAALDLVGHRLPILLMSAGYWFVYLGCALIPKIRNQHEEEELAKFRAEQAELEEDLQQTKTARGKPTLTKPRFEMPDRMKGSRLPRRFE